jgi:hypothetical protein
MRRLREDAERIRRQREDERRRRDYNHQRWMAALNEKHRHEGAAFKAQLEANRLGRAKARRELSFLEELDLDAAKRKVRMYERLASNARADMVIYR